MAINKTFVEHTILKASDLNELITQINSTIRSSINGGEEYILNPTIETGESWKIVNNKITSYTQSGIERCVIDLDGFSSAYKISFMCASSWTNNSSAFTDSAGNVIQRITSDTFATTTFEVPEGATKLYISHYIAGGTLAVSSISKGLKDSLLGLLTNGYLYKGIATPSTAPSFGQKFFYVAKQAGTYQFNSAVNTPISISKEGVYFIVGGENADAWSLQTLIALDDEPASGSSNPVKSNGIFTSLLFVNGGEATLSPTIEDGVCWKIVNNKITSYTQSGLERCVINIPEGTSAYKISFYDKESWSNNCSAFADNSDNVVQKIFSDNYTENTFNVPEGAKKLYISNLKAGGTLIIKSVTSSIVGKVEALQQAVADIQEALEDLEELVENSINDLKEEIKDTYGDYVSDSDNVAVFTDKNDKLLGGWRKNGKFFSPAGFEGVIAGGGNAVLQGSGAAFRGHANTPELKYDYNIIVIYGQSLSTGTESSKAIHTTGNEWSFRLGGDVNVDWSSSDPMTSKVITPLVSRANENSITTGVLSFTELLNREGNPQNVLAISCGRGSTGIDALSKGNSSGYYADRYIAAMNRIAEICQQENKTLGVFAFVWMQGEHDNDMAVAEYKQKVQTLYADMAADAKSITGQTTMPPFMMYGSMDGLFWGDGNPVQAMQECADEDDNMILLAPVYNIPSYIYGHLSINGYMWFGEYIGKALHDISHNIKPDALRVTGAVTVGTKTIKVTTNAKTKLIADISTHALIPNYGFAVFKNGSSDTISSVSVIGGEIYIKLANNIDNSASYSLVYIDGTRDTDEISGNIRDCNPYKSCFGYVDDTNEVGTIFYSAYWENDPAGTSSYPDVSTFEYGHQFSIGDKVKQNCNGTIKYFSCKAATTYPPYAYVVNKPLNISVGDKYPMWNWLLPAKLNVQIIM